MTDKSVKLYFTRLADLLLETQVTDNNGTTLPLDSGAGQALDSILSIKATAGKVMITGNGGSAAIALHVQNDLCHAAGIRAITFYDTSSLTACANDHGYETAFERPLSYWSDAGDILIAISSSGRSENILRAARMASALGCRVITFTGFDPENPLRQIGDINFYIASSDYGLVETAHGALAHFLTDEVMHRVNGETPHD